METESNVTTTQAPTDLVPAVRSDSVCNYLGNLAGVLSSIVVDINAQIASIKRISQTTTEGVSNDNQEN
jgi:hypothetical protein